ncbi:hypothetical protein GZ77_20480 [Endozoicomonas montiporae]|uniref:Uncharacterized protein n=2 Tax=Endozoicomonas montiporae TaxID=1027273 RepID=A0A081N305_9GAMM|nr:hypothetical protein [Endozoicomonas montiporae]AMO58114.1 hypothetical protein EZMO1_4190 [Endozoicomonas montiporae CL-33]KEQ12828.1 hypothetical protein GZ77_20480 [Endozoicomonas montiporae]
MKLIEQELAAALLPLVDDRAYPIALPQNADYPSLTFHRVEAQEAEEDYRLSPLKQRRARGLKSLFQVVAWSKTYSDCATLLRQCKNTLEAITGVYLESCSDGYEHELQLYTCVMEFAIWCDLDSTETPVGDSGKLSKVMDAITAEISDVLPGVDVARYNTQDREVKAPAVRLDLSAMKPGVERGDGSFAAACEFVAWCSFAPSSMEAPQTAARLLEAIHYNHWKLGAEVNHPTNLKAEPAEFRPGKAGFESWVVSWEQTVYLGEPEPDDSLLPDTVMVGIDPDIGLDNENKYEQIV